MDVHKSTPNHKDSKDNYNMTKTNLAGIYLALKDYHKAVKTLEEVVKAEEEIYLEAFTPTASYALNNLGICYRRINQFAKARRVYERYVHLIIYEITY